jgi:capsular polysaccharide transport system permease protein
MSTSPSQQPQEQALVLAPVSPDGPLAHVMSNVPAAYAPDATFHRSDEIIKILDRIKRFLFAVLFVLPMTLWIIYFGFIAADQYETESRFILRQSSNVDAVGPMGGGTLQQSGLATADENSHVVKAYVESRDLVEALLKTHDLKAKLDRPEADFLSRYSAFWRRDTMESLYKTFADFVTVKVDSGNAIMTLKVRAFQPADANELSIAILTQAEALVNRLNDRARRDAVAFAEDLVARNETRVKEIQDRLTLYRNTELIIDPARQSAATLELSNRLVLELAQIDTQIATVEQRSPTSPRLAQLRSQRAALQDEIVKQRSAVVGDGNSLVTKLSEYEKLNLEKDLAIKALTSSLVSLERARQDALVRRLYLERIVEPKPADRPEHPRRLLWILGGLAAFFSLYKMVSSIAEVTMERMK